MSLGDLLGVSVIRVSADEHDPGDEDRSVARHRFLEAITPRPIPFVYQAGDIIVLKTHAGVRPPRY